MEVPVDEVDNIKMLFKQCCLYNAIDKLERIEKDFKFYGK